MSRPASPGAEAKNISLRFAQSVDVEPLARLINAAFIVEQPFIEGDRIDPRGVRAYLEKGKFLVAEDSHGLAGCVYLELRGERGYLGLLGVERSEEHTSELQSHSDLVCRLLLEKKNKKELNIQ